MKIQSLRFAHKVGMAVVVGLLTVGATGLFVQANQASDSDLPNTVKSVEREVLSGNVVKQPVIVKKTQTITEDVPYKTRTQSDATLEKGMSKVQNAGIKGVRTKIFEVEYTDRIETARTLVSDQITTPPVDEVMVIGVFESPLLTQAASLSNENCDENYSGCVPIDSDVDCAGGRGNGPSYARGPVNVIGSDIYGLDADGNGIGCE